MTLIIWLIIGLIVALGGINYAPRSSSILGTILLGVLGAFLGGVLGTVMFNLEQVNFNLLSISVALFGALMLVVIQRSIVKT